MQIIDGGDNIDEEYVDGEDGGMGDKEMDFVGMGNGLSMTAQSLEDQKLLHGALNFGSD